MAFLTDIVDDNSYKNWKAGDMVFLFSGTGSGKTTLALEKITVSYLENNNTVLYLVPRIILQKQIEKDMRKIRSEYRDNARKYNRNFFVWTYQYLETLLLEGKTIQPFDLIICDEFHYFITDAVFNANTQISYDFIFRHSNGLKLFLSATPNGIMEYIKTDYIFEPVFRYNDEEEEEPKNDAYTEIINLLKDYIIYNINSEPLELQIHDLQTNINDSDKQDWNVDEDYLMQEIEKEQHAPKAYIYALPKDYNYVNIKYIKNDSDIIDIIKNSQQEKTVIFVSNKDKGKKIDEKINKELTENEESKEKKTIFITAENKNTDSKENVENIVSTNTFSKNVLITTSVLDVGVNFLDATIKNIVIAASEPVEFLQMLGRLRVIQEGWEVSLYIYVRDAQYFQNLRDRLIEPDIKCCEFIEKYPEKLENILKMEFMPQPNLPDGCTLDKCKEFLYSDCWHNNNLSLNKLAIYRLRQLYNLYNKIYEEIKQNEDYFIEKQLEWLGLKDTFSIKNFYSFDMRKDRIERLRKAIENEITENKSINDGISKDDCSKLINKFKTLIRSIDKDSVRSNTPLSIKNFNYICNRCEIPYCVGKKQDNRNRKYIYYLLKSDDERIKTLDLEID